MSVAQSPSALSGQPLRIIIVGGSLAGLMHGIALKRLNHDVHILERNPPSMQESQGAGISAMKDVQAFLHQYDVSKRPYSVTSPGVQFLNKDMKVINSWQVVLQMTSWNVLYYRLRANFDGLTSPYCPDLPEGLTQDGGKTIYDHEKTVTNISYTNEAIMVEFADKDGGGKLEADLLITADGSGSKIRRMLQPGLDRKYAGYVCWRGTVIERDLSKKTRETFGDKTTIFKMKQSYIALYIIPGENGSLDIGERMFSYVWYCNCAEDSQDYAGLMTDSEGHRHRYFLPMGKMSEKSWNQQKTYAAKVLPVPFAELVEKTTRPFISSITDEISPRASFYNGKVLLVGDALASFRPHVASSTNQAALDAQLLVKVMTGQMTLAAWEHHVLRYARITLLRSRVWGAYYQSGIWGLICTGLQYLLLMVAQWFGKHWYG